MRSPLSPEWCVVILPGFRGFMSNAILAGEAEMTLCILMRMPSIS